MISLTCSVYKHTYIRIYKEQIFYISCMHLIYRKTKRGNGYYQSIICGAEYKHL